MGPGQNPQYTGAVQRREAVGCSQGLKMSPQKQHQCNCSGKDAASSSGLFDDTKLREDFLLT